MILTDADHLREALRLTVQERDEARAEVERLRADNSVKGDYWSFAAALQDVAERQREACATHYEHRIRTRTYLGMGPSEEQIRAIADEDIRAAPLVTEGKP